MKLATSRSAVCVHRQHIITGVVGSLVVLMAALVWPPTASAQGRVLIGQGETISRLGPIANRDVAAQFGERLKVSEGFVEAAERALSAGGPKPLCGPSAESEQRSGTGDRRAPDVAHFGSQS